MDSKQDIRIEEIYIPSKHTKDNYLCEDFIIYPEGKEKAGGFLLGLVEIRATDSAESDKIIQALINTLKDEYYRQIVASPQPEKLHLETVFEHALQKTNDKIQEMINIGQIKLSLDNLNYLIAVAKPNYKTNDIDFIFTQQGLTYAYLLHKTKQNNYKIINIIDNTPKLQNDSDTNIKIFSSILSGKVFSHDTLYIASEIFTNYIPPHKVNKIVTNNDLSSSMTYYKNLINNVENNSFLTYCSIFLKMDKKSTISENPDSQNSINNLLDTKQKTEKYLAPSFALNLKSRLNRISKLFKKSKSKKHIKQPLHQKKVKFGFFKYIINALLIFFSAIINFFKSIFSSKKKQKTIQEPAKNPHELKKQKNTFKKYRFVFLIIIVILIIGLIIGLFWYQKHHEIKQAQANYLALVQEIEADINNAQVSLIYKNNNQSIELINLADEKITQLPIETQEQQNKQQELLDKTSNIKNKLFKIIKVVPQLISQIAETENLEQITYSENTLITIAADKIFTVNLDNPEEQTTINSNSDNFKFVSAEDENVLALTSKDAFTIENNGLKEKTINLEDYDLNEIQYYAGNIYALDNNEVLKFKGSSNGFGSPDNWISEKQADLSNAVDLTIDGSIYVLTDTADVYKFHAGKQEQFAIHAIEPKLENPSQIFTYIDYTYLYLLDAQSKRIVIFNKEGQFIKQLLFDSLENKINYFYVDEAQKLIWLISGNKIYQARY